MPSTRCSPCRLILAEMVDARLAPRPTGCRCWMSMPASTSTSMCPWVCVRDRTVVSELIARRCGIARSDEPTPAHVRCHHLSRTRDVEFDVAIGWLRPVYVDAIASRKWRQRRGPPRLDGRCMQGGASSDMQAIAKNEGECRSRGSTVAALAIADFRVGLVSTVETSRRRVRPRSAIGGRRCDGGLFGSESLDRVRSTVRVGLSRERGSCLIWSGGTTRAETRCCGDTAAS